MTSIKKTLLSAIIALMTVCSLLFGITLINSNVTARADEELTAADFAVAIAVRVKDDEHPNGGIRFKVRVEKSKFETLMTDGVLNEGVQTGVLVTSNAIAKTLEGGLVKANADVAGVYDLDTTDYWKEITEDKTDYYESVIAIYNVPIDSSNVKLAVMPYVVNGEETIYRNEAGVASMADAVLADDENGAAFAETYIHNYTVTYKDKDGNAIEGGSETVTYGNTIAEPKVSAPEITGYTFIGWGNAAGTATWVFGTTKVTGDTNLYAKYEINTYTITWLDEDGETVLDTQTVEYGQTPVYDGTPTKAADNSYTYTFDGWDKEIVAATEDATYTATYKSEYIDYTVTFNDYNGTEISSDTYHYGDVVDVPDDPTRAADNTYTYEFAGWDTEVSTTVNGNATYTATYTPTYIDYTITFVMDGGALSDGENGDITSLTAHYGDSASMLDDLAKTKTGYTFVKWQYFNGENYVDLPQNATVTGDITLKAVWTINLYTVSIAVNEVGSGSVTSATVANVPYNTAVSVSDNVLTVGETAITATATTATAQYTYAFDGWTNVPANVTDNVTITANFTKTLNQYTITFKNGDATLQSGLVNYGETPVYSGSTPTTASDSYYDYLFAGWDDEVIPVNGDATYTAQFNKSILAANRNKAYTLTELGGTEGTAGMGQWGAGQTLTLKDSMEGEIVFKMTKTYPDGNQIFWFTLFYDGATAANGVLFYFEINAGVVRINDKTITMGNVLPNVEYYYLIGYKVENDYSKISVRLRIETEDATEVAAGRGVLGDGTVELTSLTGTDDVAAYVNANNRFLILPQQCWFEVADAWKSTDAYASQFATLKTVYSGDETIDEINYAVQTLDDISLKCFAQVDKTAAAMNRSKELLQQGYFGVYTNEDLGLAAGSLGQWATYFANMPNKTSGTIMFNITMNGYNPNANYSWITLFAEAGTGDYVNVGFGLPLQFNPANILTVGTTYTAMISYKVASDYSSVSVNYRFVDASTGIAVYNYTSTYTSVTGSDASLATWINGHDKFYFRPADVAYTVSTPFTWSASVCDVFNSLYERQEDLVSGETLTKAQTMLEDFDMIYRLVANNNTPAALCFVSNGEVNAWTMCNRDIPFAMSGTIVFDFLRWDSGGSYDYSFTLFEQDYSETSNDGIGISFWSNNGSYLTCVNDGQAISIPDYPVRGTKTFAFSYKIADDYSKVTVVLRIYDTGEDGELILTDTHEITSINGGTVAAWLQDSTSHYIFRVKGVQANVNVGNP